MGRLDNSGTSYFLLLLLLPANCRKWQNTPDQKGKSIIIPNTTAKFMNFALVDIKDTNNTAEVPMLLSSPLNKI